MELLHIVRYFTLALTYWNVQNVCVYVHVASWLYGELACEEPAIGGTGKSETVGRSVSRMEGEGWRLEAGEGSESIDRSRRGRASRDEDRGGGERAVQCRRAAHTIHSIHARTQHPWRKKNK